MSAKTLGKRIKLEREKKRISLRKFAEMLGISAAYLVDIEKDRRPPTEELLQKTADLLDIPVATFDEFSPDVPKAVKDWLDKNPLLGKVMSLLRKGSPDETLAKFEKAIVRPRQRKFTISSSLVVNSRKIGAFDISAIGIRIIASDCPRPVLEIKDVS